MKIGLSHTSKSSRKILLVIALVIAVCTFLGPMHASAHAQSNPPTTKKLEFAVASVREDVSGGPASTNIPLRGDVYRPTGGLFLVSSMPLPSLIGFAYNLNRDQLESMRTQLPRWADSDRFYIQAKSEDPKPTKDEMRVMVRSLLGDRFGLSAHNEIRQVPVFGLVLSKPGKFGPKLKVHPREDTSCVDAPPLVYTPGGPPTIAGGLPASCDSTMAIRRPDGTVSLAGRNMPMDVIAASLNSATNLGRPVVDQTALTDRFDFYVEFAPDPPGSLSSGEDSNRPTQSFAQNFGDALRDQLGLKLVPQKGGVNFLVIDHVDHPSKN